MTSCEHSSQDIKTVHRLFHQEDKWRICFARLTLTSNPAIYNVQLPVQKPYGRDDSLVPPCSAYYVVVPIEGSATAPCALLGRFDLCGLGAFLQESDYKLKKPCCLSKHVTLMLYIWPK